MNWRKVKKLIVPLIIIKSVIALIFLFRNDMVTISRDVSWNNQYQYETGIDSAAFKKQKLIRIVRNEEERGISIILRGKKINRTSADKIGKKAIPMVD